MELTREEWLDSQRNEAGFWQAERGKDNTEQQARNAYYRDVAFPEYFRDRSFAGLTLMDVGSGPQGILHAIDGAGKKLAADPLMPKFKAMGFPLDANGVTPVTCEAERLSERFKGTVDVAFCLNVLDHTRDPQRVLQEIQAALKPGGDLLFLVDMKTPEQLDAYHKLSLPEEALRKLLAAFEIQDVRILPHQDPNPVQQFVALCRKKAAAKTSNVIALPGKAGARAHAAPDTSDVAFADCCRGAGDDVMPAMRVNGEWVLFMVTSYQEDAQTTRWFVRGVKGAAFCPICGAHLNGETPTRRYHRGFATLDMQVDAMVAGKT